MPNHVDLKVAQQIAHTINADLGAGQDGPLVFDGAHEGRSDASKVIAWDGGPRCWTFTWPESDSARKLARDHDIWFEAVNSVSLAVNPIG